MVEVSPLIGRSRRISPAAFTGRALPPAQPDPVTTGLINKNSLQLSVVSNQIQNLTDQLNSFTGSLQVISQNLANSQALERQKEAQEQELERRLAEAKLREGKESQIERKIQAKTFAPLQKLADTTQFTLGRLGGFFTSLLGGWLLVKGVETIKALSENNKEKLEEIRDNVIQNLSFIGATFAIYKTALAAMRGKFSRVGIVIGLVAAAGIFRKPIEDFLSYLLNAAEKIKENIPFSDKIPGLNNLDFKRAAETLSGGNEEPLPEVDPTKPPSEQNLTTNNEPLNIENPDAKGGPSLATPTETMMGEKVSPEIQELKNEMAGIRQDYFGGRISTEEYKSTTADLDQKINDLKSENAKTPEVSAQPQETMLGKPAEKESKEDAIDPNVPAQYGEKSIEPVENPPPVPESTEEKTQIEGDASKTVQADQVTESSSTFNVGLNISDSLVNADKYVAKMPTLPVSDMFTPIKKDVDVAQRVGPAPEPPVTVLPIPVENQQQEPQTQPVASGPINDSPSFATSNKSNIYILGAYSNFNVLPV
jgi:hypothetical protein